MDFPAVRPRPCATLPALVAGLGVAPREVLATLRDYVVVYEDPKVILAIQPDHGILATLDRPGVAITAPAAGMAEGKDFISRFFAPGLGVPEDPVTGSAHCTLAPYWASRLGRSVLSARQVSKRGGDIRCAMQGDRVHLSGHAVTFLIGEIELPVEGTGLA